MDLEVVMRSQGGQVVFAGPEKVNLEREDSEEDLEGQTPRVAFIVYNFCSCRWLNSYTPAFHLNGTSYSWRQ